MDNLAYIALWMAYQPKPDSCSLKLSHPARLGAQFWAALAFGLVLSTSLVAPVEANWGRVVYVNTPPGYALNLRWGPGTNFGVYRKVRRGTSLRLTGVRRNGWQQLTNGTWVAGNFVSSRPVFGNGPPSPDQNIAYVVVPPNLALNIRNGPGANYAIVGQFLNGTRVALSGRYSVGWAQLVDGNWVDNQFLQSTYPGNRPPTPSPQPPYDPSIADLQRRLKQLGYLPFDFVVNGINDAATQQAIREFQRVNGLPITGNADPATRQAIYEATSEFPNRPTPTPTPTLTPTPTPTGSPTQPPIGGRQARVVTDGENAMVFAGPDPSTDILRVLPNGSIVTTTGNVTGNWSELVDGGWIFSLYLETI